MKRDYKDSYEKSIKRVTHKRSKTVFWQWIENTFEPEPFVNWCLCIYFAAVLFYIMFTA